VRVEASTVTNGFNPSTSAVLGILAGVVILAFLSALVLEVDGLRERVVIILFWAGLVISWLVATVAVVAIHLGLR
jgi:hypothetical protein